jgi:transcriptional regulator with XRE-family HTH domain
MSTPYQQPRRTGGSLWGPERVDAGVTLRQLAAASGVHRGLLSQMENGRLIPRPDEYRRITAALSALVKEGSMQPTPQETEPGGAP